MSNKYEKTATAKLESLLTANENILKGLLADSKDIAQDITDTQLRIGKIKAVLESRVPKKLGIDDIAVCETIRNITGIPGAVKCKLIASIIDLVNDPDRWARAGYNRHDSNLVHAFWWAKSGTFPPLDVHTHREVWSAIYEASEGDLGSYLELPVASLQAILNYSSPKAPAKTAKRKRS